MQGSLLNRLPGGKPDAGSRRGGQHLLNRLPGGKLARLRK